MTAVEKRPRTKRDQRRVSTDRILEAALNCFVSKGYRATTVEEIAQEASLTKGAAYFYFDTKASILMALLDTVEELMVGGMLDRIGAAGTSARGQLVAAIHGQGLLAASKGKYLILFTLILVEFSGSGDPIENRVKEIYNRFCSTIEDIVKLGQGAGEFRPEISTRELAAVIMALEHGSLLEWYCRSGLLDGQELVRSAREILLFGILSGSGAAPQLG